MQQLTENNGLVNNPQRVTTHTVIAQQLQGVQGLRAFADDVSDMFTNGQVVCDKRLCSKTLEWTEFTCDRTVDKSSQK